MPFAYNLLYIYCNKLYVGSLWQKLLSLFTFSFYYYGIDLVVKLYEKYLIVIKSLILSKVFSCFAVRVAHYLYIPYSFHINTCVCVSVVALNNSNI